MKLFTDRQVDDMIKLRWGAVVTQPALPTLTSYRAVGKVFGVSGGQVRRLILAKFEKAKRKQLPMIEQLRLTRLENQRQNWGYRFLKKHQVDWVLNNNIHKLQTGLSIADRCGHFLSEFPDGHMNTALMRQIYKMHKVKKRKYRWYKEPPNPEEATSARELARVKRELTKAKRDGYRVVYIDETCFTRNTVVDTEWCLPGQNVTVDTARLDEPTLALLSGISKENGQEHFQIFPKSVNVIKFKQYLQELSERNQGAKLCLFMDQLNVHRSDDAKDAMRELGFRWIYNRSYSPELNPIELVFSKVKHTFKKLRARKLVGLSQDTHEALVVRAVKAVRKKDIVNCVNHV